MRISLYTCGTMHGNWRNELVKHVDDHIRGIVMGHWPNTPDDYTRPRQEVDHLRAHINWLHPVTAPNRDDMNGGASHGDARFYVLRDMLLMEKADFVVSYISEVGNNLGGAQEIGWAYAKGKPIVTIDLAPDLQRFDTWRAVSLSVYRSMEECARFLLYLVQEQDPVSEAIESMLVAR